MPTQIEPPVWYDIEPDEKKVKCAYCKRQGPTEDFIYLERRNKLTDLIVHKECVGQDFLNRAEHNLTPKRRTVAKIWHSRGWPTKIKLVHHKSGKIKDFSIPKELKKPKKKK